MVDETQVEHQRPGEPRLPAVSEKLRMAGQEDSGRLVKISDCGRYVDSKCSNHDLFIGCPCGSNRTSTDKFSRYQIQDDGAYPVLEECSTHHGAGDDCVGPDAEQRSRMSTDFYTARSGSTSTDATGDSSCATSVTCTSDHIIREHSCEAIVNENPDKDDDDAPTAALAISGKASTYNPVSREVSQGCLDEFDVAGEKVRLFLCDADLLVLRHFCPFICSGAAMPVPASYPEPLYETVRCCARPIPVALVW